MGGTQKVTGSFWRNADGSWICTEPVTLYHSLGRMQVAPGSTFKPGEFFMGVDLALWLDNQADTDRPPIPEGVLLSHSWPAR
jgi:hypothetical protein